MNFWDKQAKGYDRTTNKFFREANEKIVSYTKKYCGKEDELLDIGCGTGLITVMLLDSVKHIDAIDASEKMLEIAKVRKGGSIVTWKQSNIENFEIVSNKYKIITAFNILMYISEKEFLKSVYSSLPQDGYFILVTDCMGEKSKPYKAIIRLLMKCKIITKMKLYTIDELRRNVENEGFKIVFSENVDKRTSNYYIVCKKSI